jgi:hypothetical protein
VNANQYELYRDTDSTTAGRTRIASFSNMQTVSYLDSSGAAGTTYYYWLKVRDTAGQFYNSDFAQATTPAPASNANYALGDVIEAEGYDWSHGEVKIENGGTTIGYFNGTDYMAYSGVDFTGVSQLNVRYATPTSNHKIEFRLGSPTGTLIATQVTQSTGSWGNFQDTTLNVNSVPSGTHDLYVVGVGAITSFLANLDSFTLLGNGQQASNSSANTSSNAPEAGQIEYGVSYRIINKTSGKALDVSSFSQEDGAIVHQWDVSGAANQHWYVIENGSGVQLKATHSWRCLDVPAGNTANGVQMQQWGCIGNTNQRFQITSKGSGFFEVRAEASGKCLDYAGDPNVPAKIHQWDCHGGDNQLWQFVKVQ